MTRRTFLARSSGLLVPLMPGIIRAAQPVISHRRKLFQPVAASSWTPASLPSLVFWYKADAESYNDGDLVATFTDQSGAGRNATQGTDANKPTFKTNILNGKPIYRFDGSRLVSTAAFVFGGQKWSVLMVEKTTDYTSAPIYIERSTNFNSNQAFVITANSSGNILARHHQTSSSAYSGFDMTNANNTSSFYSVVATGDTSLSTNEVSCQVGSDAAGSRSLNSDLVDSFGSSHAIFIGARSGVSFGVTGDYAEIICMSDVVSAGDISNWLTYVNGKYGI